MKSLIEWLRMFKTTTFVLDELLHKVTIDFIFTSLVVLLVDY
jgi:hypothetical protein